MTWLPDYPKALLLSQVDLHFMKKIPTGAEASNVLVGEVDNLDRPIVAFVRLSPAVLLSGLTEVPIPTRYRAGHPVGAHMCEHWCQRPAGPGCQS